MALKTFNLDDEAYKIFAEHCKREGISMSRKVDNFIRTEIEKLKSNSIKEEHKKSKDSNKETINNNNHSLTSEQHSFSKYC